MATRSTVAIIGGGVAGIGAAWRLNQNYDIVLYESNSSLGGHACAMTIATSDGPLTVDMGVQAMFLPDFANLAALFGRYGVTLVAKPLSFGISIGSHAYWGNQPHNMHAGFWGQVGDDAERFTSEIRELLVSRPLVELGQISFKDFLQSGGYSQAFIDQVAYPMFAIPLFTYDLVADMSTAFIAALFVDYLERFTKLSEWYYIDATCSNYIEKVTAEFKDRVRLNTRVRSITRHPDFVVVEDDNGGKETYDQVVFATPGDVTLSLLGDPSAAETLILEGLKTRPLTVTLHGDESVFSPYFRERPVVQYTTHDGDPYHGAHHFDVRQWHGLAPGAPPIIASVNYHIDPAYVYATRAWDIDRVTPQGMYARLLLQTQQGVNRTWYCGRSVTLPSHEESFISGLVIAEYLGVEYPFQDFPQARKQYAFVKNFIMGEQGKYDAYTPFKE